MSLLSKLFGFSRSQNPANAAMPYLDQIPGEAHKLYDPYITRGHQAGDRLSSEYDKLLSDPTAFINKIMEGYKTSEGYNFQKDELMKELGNNAAAGGVAGTPYDFDRKSERVQGLLSQDMQQFLQNVLGRYDKGLAGEQGFEQEGYDASGKLTDILGGALNQKAGLAFQGQQQNNANRNAIFSALAKALGLGIGGFAGGPGGALIAGGLGSDMFGGG